MYYERDSFFGTYINSCVWLSRPFFLRGGVRQIAQAGVYVGNPTRYANAGEETCTNLLHIFTRWQYVCARGEGSGQHATVPPCFRTAVQEREHRTGTG
jgi:hypothetical protein